MTEPLPADVESFVATVRRDVEPVAHRLGLRRDGVDVDPATAEVRYASPDAVVHVRLDRRDGSVRTTIGLDGGPERDLADLLDAAGEDATVDRLRRVAAPGCELGVRVAEHGRALDALFG